MSEGMLMQIFPYLGHKELGVFITIEEKLSPQAAKAAGREVVPDEFLVPLAGVGLVRLRAKVEEHGLYEVFGRPSMEQGVDVKTDDRK